MSVTTTTAAPRRRRPVELPPDLEERVYARAMWTIGEVADLIGMTTRHVYAMSALGRLRLTRVGPRASRVAADDLASYLAAGRTA